MNETQVIIRFKLGEKNQVNALREYNTLRAQGYKGSYDVNLKTGEVVIVLTPPQVEKVGN